MRVKCVSNKDSFLIEYKNVTVGKIYNVTGLDKDYSMGTNLYTIVDDSGCDFTHGISIFRVIKEDKMEEVRVIRKLEDLEGLKNKAGLSIEIKHNVANVVYLDDECELLINSSEEYGYEKDYIKTLKAMGFKFEYKHLRTVEEVLEDMKANSLNPYHDYGKEIYEVRYIFNTEKDKRAYEVIDNGLSITLGAYIFDKETAQKYADELNDILKSR